SPSEVASLFTLPRRTTRAVRTLTTCRALDIPDESIGQTLKSPLANGPRAARCARYLDLATDDWGSLVVQARKLGDRWGSEWCASTGTPGPTRYGDRGGPKRPSRGCGEYPG